MADVKWIKITTDMFDDEKIRLIESMPDNDTILIIWIKILAQAGKCNLDGRLMLNENISYTDEMLSTIFNRPILSVRLALGTLKKFGMIEWDDTITITNWEKHQNIEGLDKIREQNRLRKQKERAKKKEKQQLLLEENNVSRDRHIEITQQNKIKNKKENINTLSSETIDIINYLNSNTNKNFKTSSKKTQQLIQARIKDGFKVDDFKKVIDIKVSQWTNDSKMKEYLRPETLFGTKFESYLNQEVKTGEFKNVLEDFING